MDNLTPYRLTIIAAVVVLVLSVAVVTVFGGPANAAQYLGLVGSIAVPGLFGLFRLEQNIQIRQQQHEENQADIAQTNDKIDALASALQQQKVGPST